MTTRQYVARRVGHSLLVVSVAYLLTYWVLFALPGDPVANRLDNPQNPVPPEQAEVILNYYNLDKPVWEQFAVTVGRLFQGDLGYSLENGRSVSGLVTQGLGSTLLLAAASLVVAVVFALVIAMTAVFAPSARIRGIVSAVPALSLATPSFLVGLVLLSVFSYQLGWVSALDTESVRSVILPALTLGIAVSPGIAQVLIHGLSEAADRPFVNVLRAKGLTERRIIGGHLLRNGSLPAVTLLALTVADLIAGSVIVEAVFNRAGLGYVTEQAVRSQDSPVVLAVVLLVSALYTLVNLLTDLVYPKIDPRVDLTETRETRPAGSAGSARVPQEVAA